MKEDDPGKKFTKASVINQAAEVARQYLKRQEDEKKRLRKRQMKINRIGNRLIFKAGGIIGKISQYKAAATETLLPGNTRKDERVNFRVGDVHVVVNFYPFDFSGLSRRMALTVSEGNYGQNLLVSTYQDINNDDPDRTIKFWENIENTQAQPVYGALALLRGYQMIKELKKLI